MPRAHRAAAVTGLCVLLLAGCGLADPPPVTPETVITTPRPGAGQIVQDDVHNAQDVAFAQDMLLHHRQALALAKLADGRTQNAKVLDLAGRITAERTPEVRELTRWLTEWKAAVPSGSAPPADHAVPGMLSAKDVAALTAAKGADFDRLFLSQLIAHHEGGMQVARDQIRTGADERARGLAEDIAISQESEIREMRALLG